MKGIKDLKLKEKINSTKGIFSFVLAFLLLSK